MSDRTFVIAGGGLAGAMAATTLREEGFDGRLVLVGNEPFAPYERPPLSKAYLLGEAGLESALVHPPAYYAEQEIELRLGQAVTEVLPGEHRVRLGAEELAYDRLLLATGAEPVRLRLPGAELTGVQVLRTAADAEALRAALESGGHVVIVGGGWIGCEVAAAARHHGADVTLVEPHDVPLEAVLGPQVGGIYRDLHVAHGVKLLTGEGVVGFRGDRRVEAVETSSGRSLECTLAVVAVGVRPRVALAADAGLAVSDGVDVDERLRTSAPDVFAAGDVARAYHPRYGRHVRVEHWANALNQGIAAGRAMLGGEEPYARLPYFFSDQYELGMEYIGLHGPDDRLVVRGAAAELDLHAFWLDAGDRVTAGMHINRWDTIEPIERIIESGLPVDPARLADPHVPLEEVVAGARA
jgi:3-phenylpropionate/trans-cinnamate dioxygenase ferredoxin reductase component